MQRKTQSQRSNFGRLSTILTRCLPEPQLYPWLAIASRGSQKELITTYRNLYRCSQKEKLKQALSCFVDAANECLETKRYYDIYSVYLPDADALHNILDTVCDNAAEINFQCITGAAPKLKSCMAGKLKDFAGVENLEQVICPSFRSGVECALEGLPDCGCRTTRVVVQLIKHLNPRRACPAVERPTPECHPDTGEFVVSSGAPRHYGLLAVTLSLVISFVC